VRRGEVERLKEGGWDLGVRVGQEIPGADCRAVAALRGGGGDGADSGPGRSVREKGTRASVPVRAGAAARERALASGADLWDLPVSRRKRRGMERGLARGDRWARRAGDGVTGQKRGRGARRAGPRRWRGRWR